jgi:nucleosome binding factor SPN SPT16 subunit
MVAGRRRELFSESAGQENAYNKYDHADIEAGHSTSKAGRARFRDAIETTLSQNRAKEMKKTLLETVDRNALEKFRKSDEEVRNYITMSRCTEHN